ncbi:hypothetical protein [Streptomyces ziwulingensis]|uniref:Secreted protein n=1 Tax=Streptomyces ziwulingensis TaxID=1045501 RepID=A0ABP9BIB7_9ACTN
MTRRGTARSGLRRGRAAAALVTGARSVAAAGAALCVTAVLPVGGGTARAAGESGESGGYVYTEGARQVEGAAGTAGAALLEAGATYRGSLPRDGKLYYRMRLDAVSNAYVSVTAVPRPGSEVTAVDGVRVSVQDAEGGSCSRRSATFGAARSPRPVTATGVREVSPGGSRCQGAGTYYVVVERARPKDSPPDDWGLELTTVSEPGLRRTGPADGTGPPNAWDSSSPEPLTAQPRRLHGGGGFAGATPVGQGVWRDDIRSGQTLFYEVPLDWGQNLYATAELDAADGRGGYATAALGLALYNPVRGRVDDAGTGYTGRRTTVDLGPVPPVAYGNRHTVAGQVSGMRFAGSYYLVVHLAEQVADRFGTGPFGLTLRLRLMGTAGAGPGYAGEPVPRDVFEATRAVGGVGGMGGSLAGGTEAGESHPAMKAVAVGGIGAGSVLLAGLGVWTVMARRRGA